MPVKITPQEFVDKWAKIQEPDDIHQALDAAVFDAYGWPHDLSDEEILERLLALDLERAK